MEDTETKNGKLFGFVEEVDEQFEQVTEHSSVTKEVPLTTDIISSKEVPENTDNQEATVPVEVGENVEACDLRLAITKEALETALQNEYGEDAILLNFEVKDFTNPGDNYSTYVTSAQCEAMVKNKEVTTSYVVKLNNPWKLSGADKLNAEFFRREGTFLTEVKSCLNKILKDVDEDHLYLPVCLYQNYEWGNEMLIMKDLRERNFKMFDRLIGMNVEHATMVVEALARVHAAGFVLKERNREKSLLDIFPALYDGMIRDPVGRESIETFFIGFMENAAKLVDNMDEYEVPRNWIRNNTDNIIDIYMDILDNGDDCFRTICHGDIWNNNIMFRYNEEKRPVEVVLLDLQMCRVSSVATDLQYFLSASMEGEDRSKNLEILLHSYYTTLERILRKAQVIVPFSFSQLKDEYERKFIFGFFTLVMIVPLIMKTEEETTDLREIHEGNMTEMLEDNAKKNQSLMNHNPVFKSRFLSAFDDGIKLGAFKKI